MMTAQEESMKGAAAEISALFPEHYEELSLHKGRHQFNPQLEVYAGREAAGQLLVVTLRLDGLLVGYFVGFVVPGLHYRSCLTLTMDLFYIKKEHRGKAAGALRLFRKVKAAAEARGVNLLMYGSKKHQPADRLFRALGMAEAETWFYQWLGDK